jgi:hypothetical protein
MATEVQTAPSSVSHKLPVYHQPEESKTECQYALRLATLTRTELTVMQVDWADLVTLDLSQFDTPGGKERLAKQLDHAVNKVGFL